MYGMINRSVQGFLRDYHGTRGWLAVTRRIGLGPDGFEPMLHYDDALTEALIEAACESLSLSRAALLEDIGAYLVTQEPLRRLLRFGGADYWEFLFSLDELRERAQMTIPDLDLPDLHLVHGRNGGFLVEVRGAFRGWGAVVAGLLRAMADDYGTLAVIELLPEGRKGGEAVLVRILETEFASGRNFVLSTVEAGR